MSETGGPAQTVDFGAAEAAAEASGHAVDRPGYVEAPAQVAGAAEEAKGAARPHFLRLSQE